MLQIEEALKRADVHSLMVPGLCKTCRVKRFTYLLASLLKLSSVVVIAMLLILYKLPRFAIIGSSINSMLFFLSATLDMVVFFSTPASIPYQFDGYTAEASWFDTPFSNRHRLSVVLNRFILLFSAITATLCATPPAEGFDPFNATDLQHPHLLYAALLVGAFSPYLTACLWMSKQFRLLCGAGAIRFSIGLMIISISLRCTNQIRALREEGREGLDSLPKALAVQGIKYYQILAQNAYFAGGCAYIDHILCLITGWTRSKKWIIWSVYFTVPVICLLTVGFTASTLIHAIKTMFCDYDEIFSKVPGYPATSAFANNFCRVITENPRFVGLHYLTSSLVTLNLLHSVHAVLLCCNPRWQPTEWTVVDHLLLKSLREDTAYKTAKLRGASSGQQLEELVTTLTQMNNK